MKHIKKISLETTPEKAQSLWDCINFVLQGGAIFGEDNSFVDCVECMLGKDSCGSGSGG